MAFLPHAGCGAPGAGHRVVLSDLADPPTGQQDIVIDNADPGTLRDGAWVTETDIAGGSYVGLNYARLDAADEEASFSWQARPA